MSMRLCLALAIVGAPAVAAAQSTSDDDRFFVDKVEADGDEDKTLWQGSLTSTSFLHREAGGISDPLGLGLVGIENAMPLRWFTDLRAQIDARHIAGNAWDARIDARARMVNSLANNLGGEGEPRPQSGSLSAEEYEIRDLFVVRGSVRSDLFVGRQTVLDLAATKIDGVRLDYAKSARWTYLGFAGLYPVRGSRSITTDYPTGVDAMGNPGKRVMPVAGGGGAAYRTERMYGAMGAVVIVPLSDDVATGTLEEPRAFVTSNGYWRQSPKLDVYHYAVFDVYGTAAFALTNLSAGVNWRPQPRLQVAAALNHVDTETLNVQAQNALEDPDDQNAGVIQNNVTVQRIASDNARASVSAGLGQTMRWEVTAGGSVRQRPEITLQPVGNIGDPQIIPAARSGEVFFQAVDRDFYGDLRLQGSFARIFGIGTNAARSTTSMIRLAGQREFAGGKGTWEAEVGYLTGVDEDRGDCNIADLNTCYGRSSVTTITVGGNAMYRIKRDWLLMALAELSTQSLTVVDGDMTVAQPTVIGTTGFVRVAYRF